jgi:NADH-quinone oxidoreductase subunit L
METVPATGLLSASWLLIALPLAGAAVLLLGGRRTDRWGHLLGTGTVVAAFVIGLLCTVQLAGSDQRAASVDLFTFIRTGSLDVQAGLLFDPLSALFVLLITGVGALIHVYSIGYMAHDPGRRRCCCWSWATATWRSTSAGRASASRPTCSSPSGTPARPPPPRRRRRSS